ncbi:YdeI/OmpD-associated family protein [bacterium]|nr:YdeI/OmpD-associated family protein [bacterium]MCB2179058.1 YdeI/OmpD-associated family protein [bacterium]
MQTVEMADRVAWRTWLAENYDTATEIWLMYYKKGSGVSSISYEASVEEALCFGWVDSIIKRIDEQKYVRKFTPRKPKSVWSPSNIRRVEKLIAAGKMTEYGLSLVEAAKLSGSWENPAVRPKLDLTMPEEFAQALAEHPQAKDTFDSLTKTYRKQYLTWIVTAKRPETKARRIAEAIRLLAQGKKLGLR